MANAQNRVEVEYKQEPELAPIHHQHMEERTVVNWEKVHLLENARLKNAQVNCNTAFCVISKSCKTYLEEMGFTVKDKKHLYI